MPAQKSDFIFGRGNTYKFEPTPPGGKRKVTVKRRPKHNAGPRNDSNELLKMSAIIEQNRILTERLASEKAKLKHAKNVLTLKVAELEKKVKLMEKALQSRVYRNGYRKSTLANNYNRNNDNIAKRYQRLKARGIV